MVQVQATWHFQVAMAMAMAIVDQNQNRRISRISEIKSDFQCDCRLCWTSRLDSQLNPES